MANYSWTKERALKKMTRALNKNDLGAAYRWAVVGQALPNGPLPPSDPNDQGVPPWRVKW